MTEKNISEINNLKELNDLNDSFEAESKSIDSELNNIKKSIASSDEKGIEELKKNKAALKEKKSILNRNIEDAKKQIKQVYSMNKSLTENIQKNYIGAGNNMTVTMKKSLSTMDLEDLKKSQTAYTDAVLPIKKALTADQMPINVSPSTSEGVFQTRQDVDSILPYLQTEFTNTNSTLFIVDLTQVYKVAKGFIEDGTHTKKASKYSIFDKTVRNEAIYDMKSIPNYLITDANPNIQASLMSITQASADSIISKLNTLPLIGDDATDPDDAITSVQSIIGSENIFLDDEKTVPAGVKLAETDIVKALATAKSTIKKYANDADLVLVLSPKAFSNLRTMTNANGSYVFPDNSIPLENQLANRAGVSDAQIVMNSSLDDKATYAMFNSKGYKLFINAQAGNPVMTGNTDVQATASGISVPLMWNATMEKNTTDLRSELYASGVFVKGYTAVYGTAPIESVDKINVNDVTPKPAADGSNDSGTGK